MKIYQIHEHGGEYEDAYDIIVGTYFSEEKAKVKMEELNEDKKMFIRKSKECDKCYCYTLEIKKEKKCFEFYNDCYSKCINYKDSRDAFDKEIVCYKIEEVEVIE